MSETAVQERKRKQGWASPGGTHDWIVRLLKFALPVAIGVLMAYLAITPLSKNKEISFILDKNKVDVTKEPMRVQAAQYRGEDNKARPFLLRARTAVQPNARDPIVVINDIVAQITLDSGPAVVRAPRARYDIDSQRVALDGPVSVSDAQGYRLAAGASIVSLREQTLRTDRPALLVAPDGRRVEARSALVDLNTRTVRSDQPVIFRARDGYQLRTGAAAVDVDKQQIVSNRPVNGQMPLGRFSGDRMSANLKDRQVVVEGRARLHIVQGGLK